MSRVPSAMDASSDDEDTLGVPPSPVDENGVTRAAAGLLRGGAPSDDGQPVAPPSDESTLIHTHNTDERHGDKEPTEEDFAHDTIHELPPFHFAMSILYLCISMSLAWLDVTIMTVAIPVIARTWGTSLIGWTMSAYMVSSAAAAPIYGRLADRYGRKEMHIVAVTIFLIGSALCGSAESMIWLILARGVQGIGGGGLLSLWQAILGNLVAVKERGTYQTWFSISWGLACASGMVVGGLIIDSWGWKWIFYINLPIGGICLLIGWYYLQLPFIPRYVPFDWLGSTLVAASTISLMIGLTIAGEKATWTSSDVQLALWGGLLGYALFSYVEYKAIAPIMPGNILRRRNIWVSCIAIFFQGSTDLVVTGFATFLQMVQLYSATDAGLLTLPYVVVNGLANAGAGWILTNTSHAYKIPFVGMVIGAIGCFCFGGLLTVDLSIGWFVLMTLPIGIGCAAAAITLAILPQAVVTTSELARTVTMVFFVHDLGIGMGFAIMEYLFISSLPIWLRSQEVEPSPLYSKDFLIATRHFFNGGGVLCLICAVSSLGLDPVPLRARAPPPTPPIVDNGNSTASGSSDKQVVAGPETTNDPAYSYQPVTTTE